MSFGSGMNSTVAFCHSDFLKSILRNVFVGQNLIKYHDAATCSQESMTCKYQTLFVISLGEMKPKHGLLVKKKVFRET